MPPQSPVAPGSSIDASTPGARRLRKRALLNLSRIGHCAPTIMQTLLDESHTRAPWLVKLTAGLPGGIGNTGGECGGITAPLVLLGLRHGLEAGERGLPWIVYKGHDLLRHFGALHGTTACREIRGDRRVPFRCIGVIGQAPVLYAKTACSNCAGSLSEACEAAYHQLYSHWVAAGFHCAQHVFRNAASVVPVGGEVLDATAGFMGGTVFSGMTCSALTAGVMALGLAQGEIENSRLRVLRMIGTMAVGGDAFADRLNASNRTMNLGHELSRWFTIEYGSTQCRAITQCDFSTTKGVRRYIDGDGTARCRVIAESVARKVEDMLHSGRQHSESAGDRAGAD